MWDDFKICAERPRSEVNAAQSSFLVILHVGFWHLRFGEHRHARSSVGHHDPLVTKAFQESMVWECEVVLKIVVDLLLLCMCELYIYIYIYVYVRVVIDYSSIVTPQLAHTSA